MPKPTSKPAHKASPPAKPVHAGSSSAPSAKANPMAAARSHGQQGAAMKAAHAPPPKATTPVQRPFSPRPAAKGRGRR